MSIGTVSRVLNDHADVGLPLRERVEAAIRELGYRAVVRPTLERDHTRVLGFLLCNGQGINAVHGHLLMGVEDYCSEAGYYLLFARHFHSPEIPSEEIEIPEILYGREHVACTILAGNSHRNFLSALEANNIRHVLLANHAPEYQNSARRVNSVRYEDVGGFAEATRYLIQLGHKQIWFLGDTSLPWFRNRYQGYASAMTAAQLEPRAHTFALADDPFENGHAAASYIVDQNYPVTALLCGSEELALGAREALRQHGRDVPSDVSLIGFQHQSMNARTFNMTCVRVDMVEVGRQLAKHAIARVESYGMDQPEVVVPSTLVKRATCRPLRADDVMVL